MLFLLSNVYTRRDRSGVYTEPVLRFPVFHLLITKSIAILGMDSLRRRGYVGARDIGMAPQWDQAAGDTSHDR